MKLPRSFSLTFLLHILAILYSDSMAQGIIAGHVSQGDTYFDVNPDSLLEASPYHLSDHPGEPMELGTDSDGVNDILISTWGGGGLGGGGGSCAVTPLIPNVEIIAHLDTSQGCCPQQFVALVADTLIEGDTISVSRSFHANSVYIWSTTYGGAMAPVIFQWNDIGEHFIGFRLCYSFDTIYGWIRVEVTNTNYFIISIKDHACNRNTHIGIREEMSDNEPVVFPNPFSDKLTIKSGLNSAADVRLYSVLGSKVVQKVSGELEMKTSELKQGIYFYEIRSGDSVYRGRVLKQ